MDDIIDKWNTSKEAAALANYVLSLHDKKSHPEGRVSKGNFFRRTLAISQRGALNYIKVRALEGVGGGERERERA